MDLDEEYGDEHEEKEKEYEGNYDEGGGEEEEGMEIDWAKFEWKNDLASARERTIEGFRDMYVEKDRDLDDAVTRALSMPTVTDPYFWSEAERQSALIWASAWFKENNIQPFALTSIELITSLGHDEGVYRVEVWDEQRACGAWRDDVLLQATLRQCTALRIMAGMDLPAFDRVMTATDDHTISKYTVGPTKFHEEKKAARKAFYERVQRPDLPFWVDPARAFELSVLNVAFSGGYPATREACMKARTYVKGLFDALGLAPDAITMICCTHKLEMAMPEGDVYVCCYKVYNAATGEVDWCTDGVLAFTRIQLVAALAVCGLANPDIAEFNGFGTLYEDSRRIREHVWKERTAARGAPLMYKMGINEADMM